jgi:Arc/MetJ-type ribon-helix-helix transcriptional regulator
MTEQELYLTARVPAKLREILKAHVHRDTHMNESEFVREAVREKLQREASDLFDSIVKTPPRQGRNSPRGILSEVSRK